jgi:hypothetical protein
MQYSVLTDSKTKTPDHSKDSQKAFDKSEHHFMKKLGIEGIYLIMIHFVITLSLPEYSKL